MQTGVAPSSPHLGRPTVVLLLVLGAALTVVDMVVSRALFGAPAWVLLVDVFMLAAIGAAVRDLFVAVLVAASASVAVTSAMVLVHAVSANSWVGTPGLVELGVLALLGAFCVRLRPWPEAIAACLAVTVAVGAIAATRLNTWFADEMLLVLVVLFASVLASVSYLRIAETVRLQNAARARQEERTELSRELHDVVGHYMTGIVLQAQAARLVLEDRPDLAHHALDEIEAAGGDALRSLRTMVRDLRSEASVPVTVPVATLRDFADLARPGAADTTPVRLHLDPQVGELPAALVASLHRIALEAVTNARRHGQHATAIDVRLALDDGQVVLVVDNDGARPAQRPPGNGGGYGLVGIGERVRALGGELDAGPGTDGGWVLRATIPLTVGV